MLFMYITITISTMQYILMILHEVFAALSTYKYYSMTTFISVIERWSIHCTGCFNQWWI